MPNINGEELTKTIEQMKGAIRKSNLLVIELKDETSAPKVFYKGEEIELKQNVFFDWDTDTDVMGGLSYAIEHVVIGKGYPITNRIERRVKGHATT